MTTRSVELLRVVHAHPGVTRADAARRLGIGTGAATELVSRLAQAHLLAEAPAAPSGARGRPTTVLVPHPDGPLVVAAEITHEGWRLDVVELGGATLTSVSGTHTDTSWPSVVATVNAATDALYKTYPGRLRAMGVSVPGTVSRTLRLDATNLGWHDVDLTELWPSTVFVAGNDASLAAAAESARGAATGARLALHLRIEGGLGGAAVDQGRLLIGASGYSGEFGHMPFGDPGISCPCGARGCWGTAVDGTALARHLGHPAPHDPVSYARRVIASAVASRHGVLVAESLAAADGGSVGGAESGEWQAVCTVAAALGRGIAGLVNGLDADLVTLGGVGVDLLAAAEAEIQAAYRAGLMAIRRDDPPPILPAALGADGPIAGAGEEAWSSLIPHLA